MESGGSLIEKRGIRKPRGAGLRQRQAGRNDRQIGMRMPAEWAVLSLVRIRMRGMVVRRDFNLDGPGAGVGAELDQHARRR